MVKNRDRGKAHEKYVAKTLGGTRMGTMGGEDVHMDSPWSIECKSRKAFVACNWMEQAKRNSSGKTPMVIVHVHGSRHDEDLVLIRLEDWKAWYGELG